MVDKEKGVEPLFACRAVVLMHKLIFCDEQTRKERKSQVPPEICLGIGSKEHKSKAEQNAKGVDGMTNAFPARQSAFDMKIILIHSYDKCLEEEGERNQHPHRIILFLRVRQRGLSRVQKLN